MTKRKRTLDWKKADGDGNGDVLAPARHWTPTCQPGIRPVAPPQYGSPMTPVLFGMQPPTQPLKSPVHNGVRRTRH